MSKACELCGYVGSEGMNHGAHSVCFSCIGKVIHFAVTAGMRFERKQRDEE